jgi:hypothetical protein
MTRTHHFPAALLVLGASIALAATPAAAFRGHVFSGTFGTEGSGNGQFKEPSDIAVNEATGDVYVLDQGNSRIEIFDHEGKYLSQFNGSETPAKAFAFGTGALTGGIAVDNSCYFKKLSGGACASADPSNGDVYIPDPGNGVVDKFDAVGTYVGQLEECASEGCHVSEFTINENAGLAGIAVDAAGTVWVRRAEPAWATGAVDGFSSALISILSSSRLLHLSGVGFLCPGFAVDAENNFLAREAQNPPQCTSSSRVSKFAMSGGALMVPFVAEETSAVAVDLASDEVFLDNVGSVGAFGSGGVEQERFGSGHLTNGTGLAVDHESSTDSTVYVADGVADRVAVFTPEPPGPPIVAGDSVSDVTGDSAQFGAEVNPRGASTQYRFEYGLCVSPSTCASSPFGGSVPVPDGVAGSDFEVHTVSATPQDLVAGAVYHFRVVAYNEENAPGTVVVGEEGSFTTQPPGVFELPDGRAWEMVSPPSKLGAAFYGIGFGVLQAAVSGDALTYLAASPTESGPPGSALGSQVLSTRGSGGWSSRDINPPHETAIGQSIGNGDSEYRFFSDDLSLGVVQRFGAFTPSLSPGASEETPYLRSDFVNGNVGEPCLPASMGCYSPLVSACPAEGEECAPAVAEHANAAPGSVFGQEGQCPGHRGFCGPIFEGAAPDLRHVVLGSEAPLLEAQVKDGLYEWSEGKLVLVSVLPQGEGGKAVTGALGGQVGGSGDSRNAISRDGSRVVWTTNGTPHLYLYDGAKEGSVRLDTGLTGTPEFQTATTDVSEVFFTENGDLYEYDVEHEQLDRLSEAAGVVGSLAGVSEDGSYVYFVANGVLAQGAEPGKCGSEFSPKTECDLYVLHGGRISLVAVLSGEDYHDWNPILPGLTARVAPDGRWLAFMSQRSLTGYDNRDALSGKPDEEVFLYDAGHEKLVCASCDPSGARPDGIEYGSLSTQSLVGSVGWESQQFLAANIPGWTAYSLGQALYQSRYLSDSGRLFFNSNEALTPQDVNGTWDVYEYEPSGVGNCSEGAVSFSGRSDGCVAPISSGRSPKESAFIDASENGGDVFFLTAAKLAGEDYDTALDMYDAHECTGASPCLPGAPVLPPPCSTGDSCKAAPSPQPAIFGAPASATFNGAGNLASSGPAPKVKPRSLTRVQKLARALRACKKKPKRKRPGCVRRARHTYGGPVGGKAKKSNRRAG